MRSRRQDNAVDRAKLARRAKPLGDLVCAIANAKRAGDIPPPPDLGGRKDNHKPRRNRKNREAPVLRDCLRWLKKRGIFAFRQNSGTLWANGQPVSFGYPGAADITGMLPDGRRLEVECKSATGGQSSKQKAFETKIKINNGMYILARSVEDLERALG